VCQACAFSISGGITWPGLQPAFGGDPHDGAGTGRPPRDCVLAATEPLGRALLGGLDPADGSQWTQVPLGGPVVIGRLVQRRMGDREQEIVAVLPCCADIVAAVPQYPEEVFGRY
jgi:hypothetical protein